MAEGYRDELEQCVGQLKAFAEHVSIRGSGAAQFIYATAAHGRSVEIARSQLGVWVEFWPADGDSPSHEKTFESYSPALTAAASWLTQPS